MSLDCAMQAEFLRLGVVLPCRSLESVRELKLRHSPFHDQISSWQQWPMAWSQLTALTSLSCQLSFNNPLIPAVLNQMTSLIKLDVTLGYKPHFCPDKEDAKVIRKYVKTAPKIAEQVIENTRGLTRLTSLVIDGIERVGQQ